MNQTSAHELPTRRPPRVATRPASRLTNDQGVADNLIDKVENFAREYPLSFGLYALGVGFVLGWKLKPW